MELRWFLVNTKNGPLEYSHIPNNDILVAIYGDAIFVCARFPILPQHLHQSNCIDVYDSTEEAKQAAKEMF